MKKIFTSSTIKIIALLTMTFDHIGYFLQSSNSTTNLGLVFRYIGRLCLPLIIFLMVMGAIYTSNLKKYLIRIAIFTSIIAIGIMIIEYVFSIVVSNNIFVTLLLILSTIYFFNQKGLKKLLVLLPIIYMIICLIYSLSLYYGFKFIYIPFGLCPDYGLYGYMMGILMYVFAKIAMKSSHNRSLKINISCVLALLLVQIANFILGYFQIFIEVYFEIQWFAIFSSVFILLYNHHVGIKNKFFQYACYLYYPLHLGIICLFFVI